MGSPAEARAHRSDRCPSSPSVPDSPCINPSVPRSESRSGPRRCPGDSRVEDKTWNRVAKAIVAKPQHSRRRNIPEKSGIPFLRNASEVAEPAISTVGEGFRANHHGKTGEKHQYLYVFEDDRRSLNKERGSCRLNDRASKGGHGGPPHSPRSRTSLVGRASVPAGITPGRRHEPGTIVGLADRRAAARMPRPVRDSAPPAWATPACSGRSLCDGGSIDRSEARRRGPAA